MKRGINDLKVGETVFIPTSILGKDYEKGVIVARWIDHIKVNFNGRIGIYTISKHDVIPQYQGEINGVKLMCDPTLKPDQFYFTNGEVNES